LCRRSPVYFHWTKRATTILLGSDRLPTKWDAKSKPPPTGRPPAGQSHLPAAEFRQTTAERVANGL